MQSNPVRATQTQGVPNEKVPHRRDGLHRHTGPRAMTLFADRPSLGLLIGLPIGIVVTLLFVALAVVLFRQSRMESTLDREVEWLFAWISVAVVVVIIIVIGLAMWPWKHDYHFWVEVRGPVEKVSSRLVSGGEGVVNQRFVVNIDGRAYSVDDTRAALIKPGDVIDLRCKREFVWGSDAHGWGCNWNGGTPGEEDE